jgi:hypothetical protein
VLRRAARFADGWYPWLTPPKQIPARLAFIKAQPDFAARPRPFDLHYSLSALLVSEDHGALFDNQQKVFDQLRSADATIDALGGPRRPGRHVDISPAAASGRPRCVSRPPALAVGEIMPAFRGDRPR